MSRVSAGLRRLHPWIAIAAFALAAFLVHRALQPYSMSEILDSLGAISARHLALGAAFTAGSFFCLTGSDTLAVRYTGRDLPYRKIALASFTSLSIGHTLGFAALSSGAVRYRFYTGWGLSPGDVGRIMLFCAMTVVLGLLTPGRARLPDPTRSRRRDASASAPAVVVAVGVLLLLVVVLYLGLAAFVHRPIRIRRLRAAGAAAAPGARPDRGRHRRLSCWSRRSSIRCSRPRPTSASFPSRRPTSRPTLPRSSPMCRAGSA